MAPDLPERRSRVSSAAGHDPVDEDRAAVLHIDFVDGVVVELLVGLVFESHDARTIVVTL